MGSEKAVGKRPSEDVPGLDWVKQGSSRHCLTAPVPGIYLYSKCVFHAPVLESGHVSPATPQDLLIHPALLLLWSLLTQWPQASHLDLGASDKKHCRAHYNELQD